MRTPSSTFQERDWVRVTETPQVRGIIIKLGHDPYTRAAVAATLSLLPGSTYNGAPKFRLEQLEHDPPAPGTVAWHKPTGLPVKVVGKENAGGQEQIIVTFSANADEIIVYE